jgi:hypothetical protein
VETIIHLTKAMFSSKERVLVEHGGLKASTFIYDSGVLALKILNKRGEIIMLPYQGQQIWSAKFDGRDLTMRSMFTQPRLTTEYLQTYGGFLLHCGFTAMGVPTNEDSHPLHGELPNAPFESAYLSLGDDADGSFMALGGSYQHTVAFNTNYQCQPQVLLREEAGVISVLVKFTNLKNTPMDYMYLAHANFSPVDHAQLVYTALPTPEHIRVRRSIPTHEKTKAGYKEYLDQISQDPTIHHTLTPDQLFDPEVVLFIDYMADSQGWAHSLQIHPDGSSDYIRHQPAQLPIGVRWICRTPDQDALGLVLPATAESEGYTAEKAKGNVRTLAAKEQVEFNYELGALRPNETKQVEKLIHHVLGKE